MHHSFPSQNCPNQRAAVTAKRRLTATSNGNNKLSVTTQKASSSDNAVSLTPQTAATAYSYYGGVIQPMKDKVKNAQLHQRVSGIHGHMAGSQHTFNVPLIIPTHTARLPPRAQALRRLHSSRVQRRVARPRRLLEPGTWSDNT